MTFPFNLSVSNIYATGTGEVAIYPCTLPNGTRVVLVDTPGFDDTVRSDTDVLRGISHFLGETYKQEILLTGIVYLHRITSPRMQGSDVRNMSMFRKLCGDQNLSNVVLVTTHWRQMLAEPNGKTVGEGRLHELREDFWDDMLRKGSTMMTHDGSDKSAEDILNYLIKRKQPAVLAIQKQLVTEGLDLSDTAAGRELDAKLETQEKKFRKEITELREELEEAQRERDIYSARKMQKLERQHEEKLRRLDEDRNRLNIGFHNLRLEEANKPGHKPNWIVNCLCDVAGAAAIAVSASSSALKAGADTFRGYLSRLQ